MPSRCLTATLAGLNGTRKMKPSPHNYSVIRRSVIREQNTVVEMMSKRGDRK